MLSHKHGVGKAVRFLLWTWAEVDSIRETGTETIKASRVLLWDGFRLGLRFSQKD